MWAGEEGDEEHEKCEDGGENDMIMPKKKKNEERGTRKRNGNEKLGRLNKGEI